MTLDDRLKKAVDSLGDKLRDEIAKELSSLNLPPPRDDAANGRLAFSRLIAGVPREDSATCRASGKSLTIIPVFADHPDEALYIDTVLGL